MREVWLVIDDYHPEPGSVIYGAFETKELAQSYLDVGITEDYGKDTERVETARVQRLTVYDK
jgi:hypothetical protein